MTCKHENWYIEGGNKIGHGYCNDCKKQIPLWILFNNQRERVDLLIYKLEHYLKQAEKNDI